MRIKQQRSMSEPVAPYGMSTSAIKRVTLIEPNYTPYNQRWYESHSARLTADFTHCTPNENNDGWLEINLTETVTPYKGKTSEPGRTYTRTISVTLKREEVDKLLALIGNAAR